MKIMERARAQARFDREHKTGNHAVKPVIFYDTGISPHTGETVFAIYNESDQLIAQLDKDGIDRLYPQSKYDRKPLKTCMNYTITIQSNDLSPVAQKMLLHSCRPNDGTLLNPSDVALALLESTLQNLDRALRTE